jgi:hypothetical protein
MRPPWPVREMQNRTAAEVDFIVFAALPSVSRKDNSSGTGCGPGRRGMNSLPGSSLCHISGFPKKVGRDMKIIDTLRYHSPRIQSATTTITSMRSHT